MQGYIDNEINLNGEQNCDGTCSDYKWAQNHQCQNGTMCAHGNFARTRCMGDVFDCNTIDSDGTACLVVCFHAKLNFQMSSVKVFFFFANRRFKTEILYFQHDRKMNGRIDAIIS